MISFSDYEDGQGNINWQAYRKAQIDNGERCFQCGSFTSYFGATAGVPRLCSDCERFGDRGEVHHPQFVRCPRCGARQQATEVYGGHGLHGIFADGEHDITCHECNHKFTIETTVSYSFRSPARKEEPQDNGETEEE